MRIILKDNIKKIAQSTAFSYREVYVLSMFEDLGRVEAILQAIAISGMGVGMYLIQKGIPQETVYRSLHGEARYIEGESLTETR